MKQTSADRWNSSHWEGPRRGDAKDLEEIWVPRHLREAAMRVLVRDLLPGAALLFGLLCFAQGALLYVDVSMRGAEAGAISVSVGCLLWALSYFLQKRPLPLSSAHVASASLALAASLVALSNMLMTGELIFSAAYFFVCAGTSMLFLTVPGFVSFLLVALTGWFLAGVKVYGPQEWPQYGFAVACVVTVTSWLFFSRYSTLKRLTLLQLQETKRRELLMDEVDHAFKSSAELLELTIRDPLTGAYNRRYLSQLIPDLEAADAKYGIVLLDLDGFKAINDRHGHSAGDRVLEKMAHFIRRQGRAEDRLIRYGGDEFLILLDISREDEVLQMANRLRKAAVTEAPSPFSMGAVQRRKGEDFQTVLHRADRAMYLDKTGGQHQYNGVGDRRDELVG